MNVHTYLTIRGEAEAEYVDRRSRFIAAICPVTDESEALAFIAARKKQFWDARHNVHAYVLRSGIQRFSDDGEPQGTAGMPVLETLQKRGLTDCVVVVTRYFGGILLGTGGLVRAYSQSTSLAIDAAGVGERRLCAVGQIECDYAQYGRLVPMIASQGGRVTDTVFADSVQVSLQLPMDRVEAFDRELTEFSAGTLQFRQDDEIFEFFEKN